MGAMAKTAKTGNPTEAGITWKELRSRAEASLDEQGLEDLERREGLVEKIRRRQERRGIRADVDVEGVKRALAAYHDDCVLRKCELGFKRCFALCGVKCSDFMDGRQLWPEFETVMRYIVKRRNEIWKMEALELGGRAQEGQRRLVTEEDCGLNQRAVEFSLKASMGDVYGDGKTESGTGGGAKVVYNLPNLTVNMITAPVRPLELKPVGEVVEVADGAQA